LRPRLLAALVLTAAVTLGAAAVALLAPLQSRLKGDAVNLTKTLVAGEKTTFGVIQLYHGQPNRHKIYKTARQFDRDNKLVGVIVWLDRAGTLVDWADTRTDKDAPVSPSLARRALRPRYRYATVSHEGGGLLAVAAAYRGPRPTGAALGSLFVLEVLRPLDYVSEANEVVRSAFLDAALVGLAVALVLGIALSSRLLRRLRMLQDASRSLDESALGTLVLPHEIVSDEIGELARAFSTMHGRLRQQEDARRAFVATASHELRTPLASLDGMLELLAEDLAVEPIDLDDARDRVASAQLQSRRLRGLASDLLDLSRLDASLELRSEPVELGETARAVAAEFDARASERGVALALDELNGQSWAQADPGSVARIVRILLDNALHVAPASR